MYSWFPVNKWFDVWDFRVLSMLAQCRNVSSVEFVIQPDSPVRAIVNKERIHQKIPW